MWFAENISWRQFRRSLGAFSAIVCKDGSTVWAEDASGKTIASGEAGVDDAEVIQAANDHIADIGGGVLRIRRGIYYPTTFLELSDYVSVSGEGFCSVLQFPDLPLLVKMGDYSHLSGLKIAGKIDPLPDPLRQKFLAGNHCIIEKLWIDSSGYGIETAGKKNVAITNVILTNIKDNRNWAAAIHSGGDAENIFIRHFYIEGCARGIEIDASPKNIFVEHGYLKDVKQYAGDGDAFSIDVHSHDDQGGADNIVYRDIVLQNCHGFTAVQTGTGNQTSDYPRNIKFENITLINPIVSCRIRARGISLKHIKIIQENSVNGIEIQRGSRKILIEDFEIDELHGDSYAIKVPHPDTEDLTIRDCKIIVSSDHETSGHLLYFYGCEGPTKIENVAIINARGWSAIGLLTCKNVVVKGCKIYVDETNPANYGIWVNANNVIVENNRIFGAPTTGSITVRESAKNVVVTKNIAEKKIYIRNTVENVGVFENVVLGENIIVESGATNVRVYKNIGYLTENSGTETFSGDGSTTDFEIGAHGLVVTDPSKIVVKVTPVSQDAINASPCVGYVDPADNTKIRVKFASAPASGTGNVKITWEAQVIS